MVVGQALAALLNQGARFGEPLVASTADSWGPALAEGLDRSYSEKVEQLTAMRRSVADAATLRKDIQKHAADLESAQQDLQDLRRRLLDVGRTQEAEQAAGALAAAQQQAAQLQRLLPQVAEAERRLGEKMQRLQNRASAFRVQKEVLKASYTSAHLSPLIHESNTATGLTHDNGDRQQEGRDEVISTTEGRLLRDVTAQMERELGHETWPQGLMELRPAGTDGTGIRILFAIEPPGTALLIAVLDGPEAVRDWYLEAILLSADMLRQVRAGQAPEAAAHGYNNPRDFLEEFYPGDAGDSGAAPTAPRDTPEIAD
jgi:hypothetical protein